MTRTTRVTRPAAAVLFALATVLSACSSSDSSSDSAGVETVESGAFTCAMSGEYRPFNFYGEGNKLQGFDVDMCKAIAKELDLEPKPVTGAFNTLVAGLQANRYDAIVGSMAVTPEREEVALFSEPYYKTGAQLFVGTDSAVATADDLEDATVGVALGTTFEAYAKELDGVGKVKTYQADIDALKDLQAGRLDAVITQGFMGKFLIKSEGLKVRTAGDVLYPDIAAIPVNKSSKALLKEINAALVSIKDDGTYAEISEKWFGEDIS
jgi:polar amino acid transport system substrate-binding protein